MAEKSLMVGAKLEMFTPSGCEYCARGETHASMLMVNSIRAAEDKWIAKGEGRTSKERIPCVNCGMMYEAIIHTVPILCEPFDCPKCGKSEKLHYKVTNITTEKDSFEFEVEIECQVCSKKRSLKKIIKSILEIIKLEVGPAGITVKNA